MEHILKCLPPYWDAVARGDKNFEVRRDDRGFQKGDYLLLLKYDPCPPLGSGGCNYLSETGNHTSNRSRAAMLRRRIKYILSGGQLGIEPGFVVLGLGR